MWKGRCQMTLDNVLAAQERTRIDVSVISNPLHYLRRSTHEEALIAIRESNRYLAEIQHAQPGHIVAFASALPCGGDAHLQELERAVNITNNDPTITEHLGDAYRKMGKLKEASRQYDDALKKSLETDQQSRLKDKIQDLRTAMGNGGAASAGH